MHSSVKRITEIDFVKGICILSVHVGHCGINLGIVTYLWQSFFMSAFFIFSGYLSKQTSFKKMMKSTLLLYYLWAIGLHLLMSVQDLRHHAFSINDFLSDQRMIILGVKQPGEIAQLWFLVALFTVKLMWEIITHIFHSEKSRLIAIAIIACVGFVLNLNNIKEVPFRLVTAMIMLPLFAFGNSLKDFGKGLFEKTSSLHVFAVTMICFFFGTFLNVKPFGHNISIWGEIFNFPFLFYCNAVLGTATFLMLSILIDKYGSRIVVKIRNAVCFYGRNSLTAFLTVNLLIVLVGKAFVKIGMRAILPLTLYNIIVCVIVILLQIPVAWFLNYPKVAKVLLLK